MKQELEEIKKLAFVEIDNAKTTKEIEDALPKFLGKKGKLTDILKGLAKLSNEEKKEIGSLANSLKSEILDKVELRKSELLEGEFIVDETFDITIPGKSISSGGLHLVTQMMYDLNDAFLSMGFELFEGPEITSEQFAFDNLNFPINHPARESMDTYWIEGYEKDDAYNKICLRPHLTGGSVRYLKEKGAPARFIYPGIVFRNEATDPRHERMFMQYEALIVDENFKFSSGKILVDAILEKVFGRKVDTRMRAGFFPFVEPGFEIDMKCLVCEGEGCRTCNNVGWIEVMPGGAPHPNVLKAAGIDSEKYSGFYINIGLDRLAMMKYLVDDVRYFYSGDLRFLNQFK